MADTLQFDLVSPERLLSSVAAREVMIPGAEGDMTALPDHAPTITTLRPGFLRVVSADGSQEYLVTGGFAEITPERASVLAEHAVPREEVTREMLDELRAKAEKAHEEAPEEHKDITAKALADLAATIESWV